MTDQEIVAHHFDHSDSNQDGELDSREWLGYLRQEDPNLKRDRSTRMLRWIYIGVGGDFFFFCYIFYFFPNECPGMCQHRPGHSLEKKSSAMKKSAWFFIFQKYGKYRSIFGTFRQLMNIFCWRVVEMGDFNRNLCPIFNLLAHVWLSHTISKSREKTVFQRTSRGKFDCII